MSKTLFAGLLSLSLSLAAAAASAAEIHGKVVGALDNPITAAVVLHRASGARAETDAEGRFVLAVPGAGRFVLEVIHPDYYEREFEIGPKEAAKPVVFVLVPLIRQNEEVVVTAMRYPEPSIQVPAASTVISGETLSEEMVPNINEGLQDVPGVGALGSAGFSLVPSVRGLARRRVLYLIDGARLESDRRTGPNASFVSPDDVERIEVLRSASSVFYGSDAIGGVIHILTREPRFEPGVHGRLLAGYGTVNGENRIGLGLDGSTGTWAFSLSFHRDNAGLYRAPGGTKILQSQFTQGSLLAKAAHRTDKREIDIGILAARGTDIGKPSVTASTKPTWYPREDQNLVQIHWKEKNVGRDGEILFHAFVNPNFLETLTDTYDGFLTKESYAKTDSTEFGAQASYSKKLAPELRLEGGLDYFGRAGAHAYNKYTSYDESGAVTGVQEEYPYLSASRGDFGAFLSADFSGIKGLDILGGVRYDLLRMEAQSPSAEIPPGVLPPPTLTTDSQPTGFVAVSYKLARELTAFVNVSRAYRLASINERFYTGISGRGFIIGQPGLKPESSFNLDGGLKLPGKRYFLGLYAFRYLIDDMIERFRLDPSTYTYGNIERGLLRGLEFEAEAFVLAGWKVFGNFAVIRGRSLATGDPLNDVPPFRIYAGTRYWKDRFSAELNATFSAAKSDPGPAEIAVASSKLVNLRVGYVWRGLDFFVTLANLFNATYIARADPDAMVEPGRNLRAGFSYAF
ncbi:MAG: TonB-dependent receptor [Candidatus Aminicenantales bacterium]